MVVYYYISLLHEYIGYITIAIYMIFSPCHWYISFHHLIRLGVRTDSFLVAIPETPAGSSSSIHPSGVPDLAPSFRLTFLDLHFFLQDLETNKRKRRDWDLIPRPLEWQSSTLTVRPRHSLTKKYSTFNNSLFTQDLLIHVGCWN